MYQGLWTQLQILAELVIIMMNAVICSLRIPFTPIKLNSIGLSETDVKTVIYTLKAEDFQSAYNANTLKTNHKRIFFFKK